MKIFCYLLTVAFIVLKLTGHIDWGWFYVLLPVVVLWSIMVVLVILGAIAQGMETPADRLKRELRRRGM